MSIIIIATKRVLCEFHNSITMNSVKLEWQNSGATRRQICNSWITISKKKIMKTKRQTQFTILCSSTSKMYTSFFAHQTENWTNKNLPPNFCIHIIGLSTIIQQFFRKHLSDLIQIIRLSRMHFLRVVVLYTIQPKWYFWLFQCCASIFGKIKQDDRCQAHVWWDYLCVNSGGLWSSEGSELNCIQWNEFCISIYISFPTDFLNMFIVFSDLSSLCSFRSNKNYFQLIHWWKITHLKNWNHRVCSRSEMNFNE